MVIDALIFVVAFFAGAVVMALVGLVFIGLGPEPKKPPQPEKKIHFSFPWKAEPSPAVSPKPLGSIPRTAGSWRRQRLDLQKRHNSQQKERDALSAPLGN